ncbi:MAG: NAD(P)/FAD-dependent oxidoreductase [Bacteriovoracaceae bacterium]|jgi:ferredoxin/flavodoxin---NADP+ reductase|nr:NAD(P)/FAD-dependent oxidoreductase [Bacteriovoracaceae bacterium]
MADFSIKSLDEKINFDNIPYWDVLVIGAGPAGLSASLTTAHRGLTTLVIEAKSKAGGQPEFLYSDKKIVDVPGFPAGVKGHELSSSTYQQALGALVQFRFNEELQRIGRVDQLVGDQKLKCVVTSKGSYKCRKVILAFGLLHFPRKVPVLEALGPKLVLYKIPKISDYSGKSVVIVGGGDSALDAAVMVHERNGEVTQVIREKNPVGKHDTFLRVKESGCRVLVETEIVKAQQKQGRVYLTLSNGSEVECDLVIVQIGFISSKKVFEDLNIRLKSDGSVAIDSYFETSRKGIFAVGDIHGDIKLITVAWAEGIQAAIYAFKEITSPYWLNEKRIKDHRVALIGDRQASGH